MADFRTETSVGARIRLARRERGFRTTAELANAIPGGNVTEAILENIESGRKADISVSQLLNIARGLNVPISMLLTPIATPDGVLDLPNLSDDFEGMSVAEFDSWLSATPSSSYRPRLAAERVDIGTLTLLRELGTLRREMERLQIVRNVGVASGDSDLKSNSRVDSQLKGVQRELEQLVDLLSSAGIEAVVAPRESA